MTSAITSVPISPQTQFRNNSTASTPISIQKTTTVANEQLKVSPSEALEEVSPPQVTMTVSFNSFEEFIKFAESTYSEELRSYVKTARKQVVEETCVQITTQVLAAAQSAHNSFKNTFMTNLQKVPVLNPERIEKVFNDTDFCISVSPGIFNGAMSEERAQPLLTRHSSTKVFSPGTLVAEVDLFNKETPPIDVMYRDAAVNAAKTLQEKFVALEGWCKEFKGAVLEKQNEINGLATGTAAAKLSGWKDVVLYLNWFSEAGLKQITSLDGLVAQVPVIKSLRDNNSAEKDKKRASEVIVSEFMKQAKDTAELESKLLIKEYKELNLYGSPKTDPKFKKMLDENPIAKYKWLLSAFYFLENRMVLLERFRVEPQTTSGENSGHSAEETAKLQADSAAAYQELDRLLRPQAGALAQIPIQTLNVECLKHLREIAALLKNFFGSYLVTGDRPTAWSLTNNSYTTDTTYCALVELPQSKTA